jgi:hypothetical protein
MGLPARPMHEKDVARESARPGGSGPALAAATALLTRRSFAPAVSRAVLLDGADPADVAEVLAVIGEALMSVFPDGGEDLRRRLGLLAADWQAGGGAR